MNIRRVLLALSISAFSLCSWAESVIIDDCSGSKKSATDRSADSSPVVIQQTVKSVAGGKRSISSLLASGVEVSASAGAGLCEFVASPVSSGVSAYSYGTAIDGESCTPVSLGAISPDSALQIFIKNFTYENFNPLKMTVSLYSAECGKDICTRAQLPFVRSVVNEWGKLPLEAFKVSKECCAGGCLADFSKVGGVSISVEPQVEPIDPTGIGGKVSFSRVEMVSANPKPSLSGARGQFMPPCNCGNSDDCGGQLCDTGSFGSPSCLQDNEFLTGVCVSSPVTTTTIPPVTTTTIPQVQCLPNSSQIPGYFAGGQDDTLCYFAWPPSMDYFPAAECCSGFGSCTRSGTVGFTGNCPCFCAGSAPVVTTTTTTSSTTTTTGPVAGPCTCNTWQDCAPGVACVSSVVSESIYCNPSNGFSIGICAGPASTTTTTTMPVTTTTQPQNCGPEFYDCHSWQEDSQTGGICNFTVQYEYKNCCNGQLTSNETQVQGLCAVDPCTYPSVPACGGPVLPTPVPTPAPTRTPSPSVAPTAVPTVEPTPAPFIGSRIEQVCSIPGIRFFFTKPADRQGFCYLNGAGYTIPFGPTEQATDFVIANGGSYNFVVSGADCFPATYSGTINCPTPTPSRTPTPSPTRTPTPSVAPTLAPTASPTRTPTASPTRTPSPSVAPTASPTGSPTRTPTASPTPGAGQFVNSRIEQVCSLPGIRFFFTKPADRQGFCYLNGAGYTLPFGPTELATDFIIANGGSYSFVVTGADCVPAAYNGTVNCPTPTPTRTPTASPTRTPSPSVAPTVAPTASPTRTPTASPTRTPSPSVAPTVAPTASPTRTPTASPTRSPTPSVAPTVAPTASPTRTPTASPTRTPSPSVAPTASPTRTPTASPTRTPTVAVTPTPTASPSRTPTATPTRTPTPVVTPTASPTQTPTPVPGVLSISAQATCADGGVKIVLSNNTGSESRCSVGGAVATVSAGGVATVVRPVNLDGSYKIDISGTNCPKQSVTGQLQCGDSTSVESCIPRGVTVTLRNSNPVSDTQCIVNGSTVIIPKGGSSIFGVQSNAAGVYAANVSGSGCIPRSYSGTLKCESPTPPPGCNESSNVSLLVAIDSRFGEQRELVLRMLSIALKKKIVTARVASSLGQQARNHYLRGWSTTWTLPTATVTCQNAGPQCATISTEATKIRLIGYSNSFRSLARNVAKRIQKRDPRNARNLLKKMETLHRSHETQLKKIAATSTVCK